MIIFPPTRERLQQSPSKHRTWKVFLLKVETMRQKTKLSTISLCRRAASSCWCAMQTYTNDSTKHGCSTQKLESIWREKQTVHGNHWCSNMEVKQGFNQLVRKCHPQRGFFFSKFYYVTISCRPWRITVLNYCSNKTGVFYFYLKFPGKTLVITYYTIILLLAPFFKIKKKKKKKKKALQTAIKGHSDFSCIVTNILKILWYNFESLVWKQIFVIMQFFNLSQAETVLAISFSQRLLSCACMCFQVLHKHPTLITLLLIIDVYPPTSSTKQTPALARNVFTA